MSANCGLSMYPVISARVCSRRLLFYRKNVMPPMLASRRVRTAMPMPAPAPVLSEPAAGGGGRGGDVDADEI